MQVRHVINLLHLAWFALSLPVIQFSVFYLWSRISRVDSQLTNMAAAPHRIWSALPYSRSPGTQLLAKLEKEVILVYTPGWLTWAQPSPKLTTPACTQVPFTIWQTRGPPESPWEDDTNTHSAFTTGRYQSAPKGRSYKLEQCMIAEQRSKLYKRVFVNVNTAAAQTADPTVPGRSPCRPPGIQHRSCHTGCPPAPSHASCTSPDINSGRWSAPPLAAESRVLPEGLRGIRGQMEDEEQKECETSSTL